VRRESARPLLTSSLPRPKKQRFMCEEHIEKKIVTSQRYIRVKIIEILRRRGCRHLEVDDVVQEVNARLLSRESSFDPATVPWEKAVVTVAEQTIANLLRGQRAGKRGHRRMCSLNALIQTRDDGLAELAEIIGCREYNARRGCDPRIELELAQLVRDVADVTATLTEEQRAFAEELASRSKAEIARNMGVPRTTLSSRVHLAMRRFENAGLQNCL